MIENYGKTVNLEKLKALRIASGNTINAMGEVIGQTYGNYYKKETGAHKISLCEAFQLASFFGVTVDELFSINSGVDEIVCKYISAKQRRKRP